MPISYCIDSDQGVVVSRAWGIVAGAEVHAHQRMLRADPAFDPVFRQLVDVRDATRIDMSATMMQLLAETRPFLRGRPCAFVTATDEQFGMARMFATFAGLHGDDVQVFRDWRSAAEWLGLAADLAGDGACGDGARVPSA